MIDPWNGGDPPLMEITLGDMLDRINFNLHNRSGRSGPYKTAASRYKAFRRRKNLFP